MRNRNNLRNGKSRRYWRILLKDWSTCMIRRWYIWISSQTIYCIVWRRKDIKSQTLGCLDSHNYAKGKTSMKVMPDIWHLKYWTIWTVTESEDWAKQTYSHWVPLFMSLWLGNTYQRMVMNGIESGKASLFMILRTIVVSIHTNNR